jgi:D-sedoheptulose 7-phosphate isomerase
MLEIGRETALVRRRFEESAEAKRALLDGRLVEQVAGLAELLASVLRDGGKVILFGNGGSAADATHLAAELVGRYTLEREPLPALSLTDNASSMSAIGNDYAYEDTFARQVRGLGQRGDVAIGFSTSGGSRNVVRGLEAARASGLHTAAVTGADGGDVLDAADIRLRMPATATARVQECTMLVGHTLCELVERSLFLS